MNIFLFVVFFVFLLDTVEVEVEVEVEVDVEVEVEVEVDVTVDVILLLLLVKLVLFIVEFVVKFGLVVRIETLEVLVVLGVIVVDCNVITKKSNIYIIRLWKFILTEKNNLNLLEALNEIKFKL